MSASYDICVDYDVLCELEYKLELIMHDLNCSTEQMAKAILNSEEYLSGHQFEKAKQTTKDCIKLTEKTGKNIKNAIDYLKTIEELLIEYGKCVYEGGKI